MVTMQNGAAADEARERATTEIETAVSDLFRTVKGWNRELARRFDPPLSMVAFGLLRYVRHHGPVRAGDLAAAFDLDKAFVSRSVGQLREAGLLEQTPDPEDGRATLLVATATAIEQFDRIRADVRRNYESLLDDWEIDDLNRFSELLARFQRALP
ncbi:MarR family winged helix-turn-helix transcriptional regulator [uncultured Schumannella sp.]|uniref:MarR family winged helix-turn-helix transcriptional regulator n=1 Tax=uncultured Schumannella sp. TaxID=1195956 RepID=UPI0025EBA89A|nr:MarR family transcriptional regulator [uncultured Schumannella sp.]